MHLFMKEFVALHVHMREFVGKKALKMKIAVGFV